ncbi:MAG: Gfo/Idh/MocA family oxidoreductase, partial [Clostridia bacterium]|nr:Gfo/Idh/MocA family oxidoreductase [Clostridia bacterium]
LAGKHVYSEKPLATNMEDARELVALAQEKGLYLGGAPDTFMGAGIQTSRNLIDAGLIGRPIAAQAHFLGHGPESWHPDPYFFFEKGGGPMLDMGPYYITTLVNIFGRATEVTAFGSISFPDRVIGSEPHKGDVIHVEVDTFTTGAIRFASGAVASYTASFDVYTDMYDMLMIYGTEGTLKIPDPNRFDGVVKVFKPETGWQDYPLTFPYSEPSRSLGLADMAKAIEEGITPRAGYQQQLHVLDIMTAFSRSNKAGAPVQLDTPYERQRPMWQEKEF